MTTAEPLPPAALAAARDGVKAYLRIGNDGEDALLAGLVDTALGVAEAFLGQATIARGFGEAVAADGRWHKLTRSPVRAITGLGEVARALPVDAYRVDIDADGVGWARVVGVGQAVTVTYRAGLAEAWDALPAPLAHGAVMLAAHLFDQRGGDTAPPAAVAALWRPFRRMTLGAMSRWVA